MTFLTDEDYRVVAGEASLKILKQSNVENRDRAEATAIDEIKGYIGSRFDSEAVFAKTGASRSPIIIMRVVDIALYHLVSAMPNRMGYEIREIRYKMAIDWLKEVQKGNIAADLPTMTGPNGDADYYNPVSFNPGQKNKYDW